MNDGEDQGNGRDGCTLMGLRRLYIGGVGWLGCNHRGGGVSLQGEESMEKEEPDNIELELKTATP